MKLFQFLVAALLLIFMGSLYAEKPQTVIVLNTDDIPVPVIIQNGDDIPVPVKGTIDATIAGGEMDVNVVSAVPCEAPARFQYVGWSSSLHYGDEGILSYTRACQATFGLDARMCNTIEVMETVDTPILSTVYFGWVRPVLIGNGFTDASGISASTDNLTCNGWTARSYGPGEFLYGMIVDSNGRFKNLFCDTPRRIACCSPVQ